MKNSKTWVIILLALVLIAAGWLYWPRPLSALINWDNPVQATHIAAEVQPDATTSLGTASFILAPGSPEHGALHALFSRFRWHKGFDTLFRDGIRGFRGMSAFQFQEMSPEGILLEVADGTATISLAGKAAKIGYLGAGDAQRLVAGTLEIISHLSPAE